MAITVTDTAVEKFREVMDKEGLSPADDAVRLSIKGGGCSGFEYFISFDKVGNQDEFDKSFVFGEEGADGDVNALHLYCDAKSYFYLNGTEVDWMETVMERRFIFNNPLAQKSCGCGTSFSV